MDLLHPAQIAAWLMVHALAGAITWSLRFDLGPKWSSCAYVLFAVCLAAVAWLLVASYFIDAHRWVFSGATLGAMLLTAVFESGGEPADPVLSRAAR